MEKHVIAEIMHHLYWPMGAEIIELGGVVGIALCILAKALFEYRYILLGNVVTAFATINHIGLHQ